MPTEVENRYLESMLAWEQAPVLPVGRWFHPSLVLQPASNLSEEQLREELWSVIEKLYEGRIILDFTDHLSDRDLYNLIRRDILPTSVKRVDLPDNYFHWDCSVAGRAPDCSTGDWYPEPVIDSLIWLTYYADNAERSEWEVEYGIDLLKDSTIPASHAIRTSMRHVATGYNATFTHTSIPCIYEFVIFGAVDSHRVPTRSGRSMKEVSHDCHRLFCAVDLFTYHLWCLPSEGQSDHT